jgi:hypothetical protein
VHLRDPDLPAGGPFAILTRISQDSNRKLRDIAAALVGRTAGPATAVTGSPGSD